MGSPHILLVRLLSQVDFGGALAASPGEDSEAKRVERNRKQKLLCISLKDIDGGFHRSLQMKSCVALLLCLLIPVTSFAADNSYKVTYDGGSVQDIKSGTDVRLVIDADRVRVIRGKTEIANIPAKAITEISYGQDVHRRVGAAIGLAIISFGIGALMALSKSKKHYIGLTWADGDKKGGFAMQCDKNEYRGELAALEGITGKKAVDSDAMTVKN
jgi:hypothetical protein